MSALTACHLGATPYRESLALQQSLTGTFDESLSYGSYTFGDPATPMLRSYLGDPMKQKHLTRDDAYMLSSVAADLAITQLVDGNKGVHAMIPKAIFKKKNFPYWYKTP